MSWVTNYSFLILAQNFRVDLFAMATSVEKILNRINKWRPQDYKRNLSLIIWKGGKKVRKRFIREMIY